MQTVALIIGILAAFMLIVAMIIGASPYLLRKITEEPEKITDLTPRGKKSTYTPAGRKNQTETRVMFKHDVAK